MHTLQTVLKFGKHKGKTVNQILQEEPDYINWCLKNIDTFQMSEKDKEKIFKLTFEENQRKYDDCYGVIDIYDFCD